MSEPGDIQDVANRLTYAISRVHEADRKLADAMVVREQAEASEREATEQRVDRTRRLAELLIAAGVDSTPVVCRVGEDLIELTTSIVNGESRAEVRAIAPVTIAELAHRAVEKLEQEQPAPPPSGRQRRPVRRNYDVQR